MNFLKDIYLKSKNKISSYKQLISERYIKNKQKIINLKLFENSKKTPSKKVKVLGKKKKSLLKTSKVFLKKVSNIKIDISFESIKKLFQSKNYPINKKSSKRKVKSIKNKNFTIIENLKNFYSDFEVKNKNLKITEDLKNIFTSFDLKNKKTFLKEKFNLYKFKLKDKIKNNDKYILLKDYLTSFQKKLNNNNIESSKLDKAINNFVGIFYNENDLYLVAFSIKNNETIFYNLLKIDIPTDIVGETKIENIPDFSNIVADIIEVFDLEDPKVILFLGSSFFTLRSFDENKISSFSNDSEDILSKSPFLAHNTLVTSHKVIEYNTHSFYRVAYLEKESIDTWADALEKIDLEVVTITSPIFSLLDKISSNSKKDIVLVCDIEKFSTTVYLQKENKELFNTKLPYGASLYISSDVLSNQYEMFLLRLKNSVNQIIKNNNYSNDFEMYLTGTGLNLLIDNRKTLDEPFKRIPQVISRNYSFDDDKLKDLEQSHLSIFEFFSCYCEEIK